MAIANIPQRVTPGQVRPADREKAAQAFINGAASEQKGKQEKTQLVQMRIPADLLDRIDKTAKLYSQSRSSYIRDRMTKIMDLEEGK